MVAHRPLRPQTTKDKEKVKMAQVAAHPTWTRAGSPCNIWHIYGHARITAVEKDTTLLTKNVVAGTNTQIKATAKQG